MRASWCSHPRDPVWPGTGLQHVRNVRLDFSGLSFQELRTQHPVVQQLADIWKSGNALNSLVFFVPPLYNSLLHLSPSKIEKDPAVEQLLSPLLRSQELNRKFRWEARDFAGIVHFRGSNALCRAIISGNEELVRFILQQSHEALNQTGIGGLTPLHWAALKGHSGIAKLLIETDKVEVNSVGRGRSRGTPIYDAIFSGNERLVRTLLETGRVNLAVTAYGLTPLRWAQERGNRTIERLLRTYNHHDFST